MEDMQSTLELPKYQYVVAEHYVAQSANGSVEVKSCSIKKQ